MVGTFSIELVVNDGFLSSPPDTMTITVTMALADLPPFLAQIGDQTVPLGATLVLQLAASDPNGDALAFMATPLPLP